MAQKGLVRCLRGPGSKEATAPRRLYVYPIRACMRRNLCSPPLSMQVETLHDYLRRRVQSFLARYPSNRFAYINANIGEGVVYIRLSLVMDGIY